LPEAENNVHILLIRKFSIDTMHTPHAELFGDGGFI